MKTKLLTLITVMVITQNNLVSADVCRPERDNLLRVTGVEDDDTLNVRAGYTTKYEVLFKLAPDADGLNFQDVAYKSEYCLKQCSSYLRGEKSLESDILEKCRNKSKIWYSIVDVNGKQGWASGKYLTEYTAVDEDVNNVTASDAYSNNSPSLKLVGKDSNTAVIGKIKTDDKPKLTTEEQAKQNIKMQLSDWFLIHPELRNENFIKFVADKWIEADRPGDPKLIEELLLNATNQFAEFTRMNEQKEQERAKEIQLQALEKIEVQRTQQIANNFGYKEIKPGRTLDEIEKIAGCRLKTDWWSAKFSNRCYNSKKYTFWASVDDLEIVQWVKRDLGHLDSLYWYDYIASTADPESGNIYASMRKNLDTKYKLEYEFTDRDVAFFNNEELNLLRVVYEKGMVILKIERVQASEYKKEVRLRLVYQNPTLGEAYYKEHLPSSISSDDF